jgi:hypothetical protein
VPYREAVGALNWAALATRPDIAFAVATVARFAANPGPAHWEAVADIRRVLDRMQVQYRETKTGFDCIHLPSIDISSLQDPHGALATSPRKHRKQGSGGSGDSGGTTRRIVRKASKLSFGVGRKDKDHVEHERKYAQGEGEGERRSTIGWRRPRYIDHGAE